MSSARGQTLIHKCLVGLLLSACCTAFAFATDTDAWLMHLLDTVSASSPLPTIWRGGGISSYPTTSTAPSSTLRRLKRVGPS